MTEPTRYFRSFSNLGFEFLSRVGRTSALIAPLVALFLAAYISPASGSGFLLGTLWCMLNLLAIISLVKTLFGAENPSKSRVACVALLKFPVLYSAGFLLLRAEVFPLASLVSGFSLILSVILLKAFGALVAQKLNERRRENYAQEF